MVVINSGKNQLKVDIPISGIDELHKYQNGLLSILRKIKIDNCDPEFKEHLKTVYELLSHLQPKEEFHTLCKERTTKEDNEKPKNVMAPL